MHGSQKQPFVLFRRPDSPNYWMRFSIPGHGQKRVGLKTGDEAEAWKRAQQEYNKAIWKAEEGLLEGKTSFDKVANAYLASAQAAAAKDKSKLSKVNADRGVLERYMIPFFKNVTITSIKAPKLYEYLDWRRTYWTEGPGKEQDAIRYERNGKWLTRPVRHIVACESTLRREAVTLRAVFKHACKLGYIAQGDIPRIELSAEKPNKRPSFTEAELNKLFKVAEHRIQQINIRSAKDADRFAPCLRNNATGDTAFQHQVRFERIVLYCFASIALHTGMRPTELYNLNWAHVVGFKEERKKPIKDRRIRILAYGKGRKPQPLVPNIEAFGSFDLLWNTTTHMFGREPNMNDPVFVNAKGERVRDFKKGLNALLEAAGLKTDPFGRPRTAYSFRHTYATRQLSKGTSIYTLAINMRTSVRMIEMYYSDAQPEHFAKALEGSY